MKYYGCSDVKKLIGRLDLTCCSSCHDDREEFNMDMCTVTIEREDIEVCCSVMIAFDEYEVKQLARSAGSARG